MSAFFSRGRFIVLLLVQFVAVVALFISALWSKTALSFRLEDFVSGAEIISYVPFLLLIFAFFFFKEIIYFALVYTFTVVAVFFFWNSATPSHDRVWLERYSRMPRAEVSESGVTFYDVRDFKYHGSRENVSPDYINLSYEFDELEGVDFTLSHWDDQLMIAHSMLIFRFRDKENLVISVETRQEKDEPWGILPGFFNQYELIYILGTERDHLFRRTEISKQDVFVYPTNMTKDDALIVLKKTIQQVNKLYQHPRFYNTLAQNCTSSLFEVSRRPELFDYFNPQLILNGVSDRYLRQVGIVEGGGTYWEWKFKHYVSPKVRGSSQEDYSSRLRENWD